MALIKVEVVLGGCCTRVAYYDQCHRQYVSYPSEGGRLSRTSHLLGMSDVIYISIEHGAGTQEFLPVLYYF